MEVKKTNKASLKGNNILYFLAGLNVVLLVVLGLFSYKDEVAPPPEVEVVEATVETDAFVVEIPEPETPPPPPPPDDAPPPPPPPPVPTEIIESPDPVEPPPLQDQKITPPDIPVNNSNAKPGPKVNLDNLKTKVKKEPKERVTEPVSVNRVKDMAVYPGCEKYRGNKRELTKCFSDQLQDDILRYLDTEYPDTDKNQVAVRLKFHVSTDGYLTDIVPEMGDDIFKPQAKEALERVAGYLKRKNKRIEPAKMADGSKAILIFNKSVVLQNPN